MTDRELLERAAKAAGYWDDRFNCPAGFPAAWDPLADDGDALRLAVKLRVTPMLRKFGVDVVLLDCCGLTYEEYGDDPYAATRRAIVRAAAAMADDTKPE